MPGFEDSYIGRIRRLVGNETLILPAARAVIQDESKRILLIRRRDNGQWGFPAGAVELGDSIFGCLKREVKEETGLDVISATPIALYTEPRYTFVNMYGDTYQLFSVTFRVDKWEGNLLTETDETIDAGFFPVDALPELPAHYLETLDDLQKYDGRLIVK
jgi:8-oxo-dGTP pyrophosphatase MutT (NUDIX family)